MRALVARSESGQALIFVGFMLPVLALITGLAVEGGRMFVTYRQMQAAADVAAIVGAQSLPGNPSQGQSDACTYVGNNGFDACAGGTSSVNGTSTTTVCVPPETASPYAGKSYGGNTNCSTATSSKYIEVRVSDTIGTVPIFNIPVTLFAHAVAQNGIPGVADYAIVALDPTSQNNSGLFFNDHNGLITNGSITSNDTNSSSSIHVSGNPPVVVCNGKAYTSAATESLGTAFGTTLYTYNFGDANDTLQFAPPGCVHGGAVAPTNYTTADNPTQYINNAGQIPDPYASTVAPTTGAGGNMATNCALCANGSNNTYYLLNGVWTLVGGNDVNLKSGDVAELWPGTYNNIIQHSASQLIFNPGVYTIDGSGQNGGIVVNTGTMGVFGAPICDNQAGNIPGGYTANCASVTFGASNLPASNIITSGTWYYYCSPWGIWDNTTHGGLPGGGAWSNATPPTFIDRSGSPTSAKLDGVTFYLENDQTSIKIAGSPTADDIAMPNPCSGTGSDNPATPSVDFPQGSASYYRQTGTEVSAGISDTSYLSQFQIYPNGDLTRAGDLVCPDPGSVWAGELGPAAGGTYPPGQHLQFLVYADNDGSSITITGSGQQDWWGILHTFPPSSVTSPPTSACGSCSISVSGSAGGAGGPAMLFGQAIADNDTFGGDSLVEVFNRPGGRDTGPGSALIQ